MQLPFFSGIRVLKDASWPANEIMEILYYMNDVKGEKKFLDKQIIYLHGCLSSRLTASLNSCCKSSEQSSQVQFCDWLWSSYFPNVVHRSTCRLGGFLCQNNNFSVNWKGDTAKNQDEETEDHDEQILEHDEWSQWIEKDEQVCC